MITVAYDFGPTVRVIDLDANGAWIAETETVVKVGVGGRTAALFDAGYRLLGEWTKCGEAASVEVLRPGQSGA
ncbi:hypothetical protein B7755_052125 [Streptomyces sp. NBS 14/10]|uniref:hypothetical protein n=1 Tax=Streptomyces sp. NBS 14/10 TaxID=1945643 RepID=UPI000B7F2130|nr:hypothetical protein [Streptomyces sp. NBS 14/10]KAK1176697.1 hypothetical protein B7755_052125 [Streptomyces sp. NBS 14/10]